MRHSVNPDKGHDAASIDTIMPDGAAPFAGKMNQEVNNLAGSRGCTPFNLGADLYWLVEKATKVPELNEAHHTLTFSLAQVWAFVDS